MPITQDRMIAIVNAGRDYKQAYESTRAAIEHHFNAVLSNNEEPAIALEAIFQHTKPAIVLQNISNSAAILEVEHAYFRHFRKRNDNAAARALRKRRSLLTGLMTQPSAEPTQQLPQSTAPKQTIRPTITNIANTDEEQVQSDTELILDDESKSSILDFINKQDDNKPSKG